MSITNVITKITVDMAGDVKRFAVKAKQYDRATRVIVVSLLWDEVPYVLDSEDTVRCNVHKPDGTIAIIEGDNIAVSGNTVTITLPGTALTAAGRAWADIEIETQDESQQISCQCFEIDIAKSPVDDDSIISTNEFSAMKLATKAANDAAAAATAEIEATAAAGTAASQAAAAAQAATDAANQAAAAATASIQIDPTLTDNSKAAPAGMVGEIKEDLSRKTGLSEEVKQALLACLQRVAWISEDGGDYYNALESALYPPANITRITAVYTQSGAIYNDDSLDVLKPDLVVTAYYDDSTEKTVTNYTLTGTLNEGVSAVTAHYGGFSAAFNVTVSSYILYSLPEPRVFTGVNGDVLNTGVVVMPEDRDITITLSATPTEEKENRTIFYAGYTSDNFESITIRYNSPSWGMWTSRPKVALDNIMNNEMNKIVIRHRAGSGYAVDYYNSTNGRSYGYSNVNNTVSNEKMIIGGANEKVNLQGYNFVGTIHDFTVYTRYIDDDEVTAYLGE